jgi:CRP/FNR family cyclic AMP-dependent transcriptional regulator
MDNGPAREDALAYLPCSRIAAFRKGEVIYDQYEPSDFIYLIIDGKVKVSRVDDQGRHVIVDIYQVDEFFGEAAFLGPENRREQATALEETKVMTWPIPEINELIMKEPRLGVALVQVIVERLRESMYRIESFSTENISRRLARSLLRFADRLGENEQDGAVFLRPFTHELLSQYVGTSREIVTHWMARFQRDGYVKYSRKGMLLYPSRFRRWMEQQSSPLPEKPPGVEPGSSAAV